MRLPCQRSADVFDCSECLDVSERCFWSAPDDNPVFRAPDSLHNLAPLTLERYLWLTGHSHNSASLRLLQEHSSYLRLMRLDQTTYVDRVAEALSRVHSALPGRISSLGESARSSSPGRINESTPRASEKSVSGTPPPKRSKPISSRDRVRTDSTLIDDDGMVE
jgi:hypothetical protein